MIIEGTEITVEDHEPSERILVIAPNKMLFVRWCREHDINPNSRFVQYVSGTADLVVWRDVMRDDPGIIWYTDLGGVDPEYNRIKEFYEILTEAIRIFGFRELPR